MSELDPEPVQVESRKQSKLPRVEPSFCGEVGKANRKADMRVSKPKSKPRSSRSQGLNPRDIMFKPI